MSAQTAVILHACREAWSNGYQAAIDAMREYGREFAADADTKHAVEQMALHLEAIKPR